CVRDGYGRGLDYR
nr:immunoglobulin heavy chain junction region [Macaca mulatta]